MEIKPSIRYADDMKDVLFDKKYTKNDPLYYMYRAIEEKNGFRYDITEIPSRMLGSEFVKTKGHYHDDFQEIYIVLEGEAIFLMQKGKEKIEDIYFVHAKKGEIVIIPYGYGHVTINPANKDLKMANWVSDDAGHDYESIQKKHGAAYFYTTSGWIKNNTYASVPNLREEKPLKKLTKGIEEICKKCL